MNGRVISETSYIRRRGELQVYFDRTAVDGWKRLVSDAPVSRIRQTVRAGRDRMRSLMLSRLPKDLAGWRILDAGCGSGVMALELARRGAEVTGIDLSPEMIRFAEAMAANEGLSHRVRFAAGDMLAEEHGSFDAVVAMDSLIHYERTDAEQALAGLASRTSKKIIFTVAPHTPLLAVMHMAGKAFPRGDRSPAIVPVKSAQLLSPLLAQPDMEGWTAGAEERVSSGFYISQCLEVTR